MDWGKIADNLREGWDSHPGILLLLLLGFVGFLYLVIDSWRHRRHRKRPR